MSGFPKEIRSTPRTQAEIDAENNRERQEQGVAAFVDATNTPDGGAYGYELMLGRLFQSFEGDHGAVATVNTVLDALKPVLRHHHDLDKVCAKLEQVVAEIDASK